MDPDFYLNDHEVDFMSPQNQEILNYLMNQEAQGEYMEELAELEKQKTIQDIKNILNCIIDKIEDRARHKAEHEAKVKAHNQYPLFDISTIVKNAYIDNNMYEQLVFRETLVISKVNPDDSLTPVGGMCLDVQSAKGRQPLVRRFKDENFEECLEMQTEEDYWYDNAEKIRDATTISDIVDLEDDLEIKQFAKEVKKRVERDYTKFLVHLNTQLDVDGKNGGSKMTAWVDRNFHTLEEKRKEYIVEPGENIREKALYVAMQKGKYYVKSKTRPENARNKRFYSFGKTKHFIGEGANFILMRFLAIYRHFGIFEMSTMYINGNMCRNIYVCNGPAGTIINGNRVDVCKIYRLIREECGIEHVSCTVITLNGQIIKHEWDECDYVIHINPLATIRNEKPNNLEDVNLKNMWQEDMQLFSMYLDEKNTTALLVQSYMLDHPELTNLVADYIQHILTLKPAEILDFTVNHFKNFAPSYFPRNDYYDNQQQEEEEIFTI